MEIGNRDKRLKTLERVKGIEPSYSAWKNYAQAYSARFIGSHWHHLPVLISEIWS
jgi:hypothetical protein